MKEAALLAVSVILFLAFISYVELAKNGLTEKQIQGPTLALSADKEVYHSSEEMRLNASIETRESIENVTIKIYGIKDRRGNYRVKGERIVSIEPPVTNEMFSFRMPSCYGCAGMAPREYEITFELVKDGEIIGNFSGTVRLVA